jgi:hypothetical protein
MSNLWLNLDELDLPHQKSEDNKQRLFESILQSCHNKIRKYNSEFKSYECRFDIPPVIIGRPPYRQQELAKYLYDSLIHNGLKVTISPNLCEMFISWRPDEINRDQYRRGQTTPSTGSVESGVKFMAIQQPPEIEKTASGKKHVIKKPLIQHVAMVNYGGNRIDMIPINPKALASPDR